MSIFYKGKQIAGNEVTLSEVTAQLNQSLEDLEANRLSSIESLETKKVGSLSEIDEDRENSLNQIDASRQNSLAEIQQLTNENTASFNILTANSIEELDTLRNNSLSQVESTRDSVVADVTAEGTVQVNLCKDQVNLAKDEVALATAQAELATQKAEEAVGVAIGAYLDIASNSTYIPSGYLLRDGAEYSKSQFESFYSNWLGNGEQILVEGDWIKCSVDDSKSYWWYDIIYANGKFVAFGYDAGTAVASALSYVTTSNDGIVWSTPTAIGSTAFCVNEAVYANGLYVAVGSDVSSASTGFYVSYSTNAKTWTTSKINSTVDVYSVAYGNGIFVACGSDAFMAYSSDGKTWTTVTQGLGTADLRRVVYGNGKFIAIGNYTYIYTSTDGVTWTQSRISKDVGSLHCLDYINDKFIVYGDGGYVITSTDGTTWEDPVQIDPDIEWGSLSYGNGKFIIAGYSSGFDSLEKGNYLSTSIDGKTWTPIQKFELEQDPSGTPAMQYAEKKFILSSVYGISFLESYTEVDSILKACTYSEYNNQVSANGFCDKFAVDAENQKFRAPLANPNNRVLIEKKEPTESDPTWYNLYNDGWCEQGGSFAYVANGTINLTIPYQNAAYQISLTDLDSADTGGIAASTAVASFTESTITLSTTSEATQILWETKGYTNQVAEDSTRPYVVVANGELNQSDMDWSQWATSLEGKVDKGDMIPCATIIEWYENGTEGYILYSNNYCEQWGKAGRTAVSQAITLFKSYRDVNYGIMLQPYHTALSTDGRPPLVYNAETKSDGFTLNIYTGYAGAYWRTYGFVQG